MKIKGENIADGMREWLKDELKSGPTRGYDLGKFFFGVSSGTIGVITGAKKLTENVKWDWSLSCSFLLLAFSILVSLIMVIPKISHVGGETDLFIEHARLIREAQRRIWGWFLTWFVGAVLGVYSVLAVYASPSSSQDPNGKFESTYQRINCCPQATHACEKGSRNRYRDSRTAPPSK